MLPILSKWTNISQRVSLNSPVSFGEESIAIYAFEKERDPEKERETDGTSEVSETLEPVQG